MNDWEPGDDDIARVVVVVGHMGLGAEEGMRMIHALQRLDIRLVDASQVDLTFDGDRVQKVLDNVSGNG